MLALEDMCSIRNSKMAFLSKRGALTENSLVAVAKLRYFRNISSWEKEVF